MMRLSSLVVCATILACAMAQTTQPAPTAEPPTLPPNEYVLKDPSNGKTCIRMVANVNIMFEYENETSKMPITYSYNFTDAGATVDDDKSQCSTKLVLGFDPPEEEGDPNFVTFSFVKLDNNAWTSETVQYNFTVTEEDFPDIDPKFINQRLLYTATNKLLDRNVDLGGSYKCNTSQNITFNSSPTDHKVSVTLEVVTLQIQAYFDGGKEEFGTATECNADSGSKGNKIVPIAVGAALAGLVIVVLIAYLIGRLKSRRQSSYEALS